MLFSYKRPWRRRWSTQRVRLKKPSKWLCSFSDLAFKDPICPWPSHIMCKNLLKQRSCDDKQSAHGASTTNANARRYNSAALVHCRCRMQACATAMLVATSPETLDVATDAIWVAHFAHVQIPTAPPPKKYEEKLGKNRKYSLLHRSNAIGLKWRMLKEKQCFFRRLQIHTGLQNR